MYGFKRVLPVFSLAGVLAIASVAPASVINMSTAGGPTTLFYDDFESATNVSEAAFPDTSGSYDPVGGAPGTWTISEVQFYQVQVTDLDSPGAYEGNNYLRVARENYGYAEAKMGFETQSQTSDVIHFEAMIQGVSSAQVYSDHTNVIAYNDQFNYYDGANVISIPGLTFKPNEWQKWEIDYAIGATTFTLTVDGVSVSGLSTAGTSGSLSYFALSTNYDATAYLDEIPEPSTLVLLAAGLVGLLAYAWRKQR